jgi:hypothetical protein
MKSKQKKPAITKADFARSIGISPQNLQYHLKSGDAPPIGDTEAWTVYLAGEGRDPTLPKALRERIAKERLKLIRENVIKAELDNKKTKGELIEFSKVETFLRFLTGEVFFGELERLTNEWPAALKGQNEISIQAECKRQTDNIKKRLQEQLAIWEKKKD